MTSFIKISLGLSEINLSSSGLKARIGIEDYKVENCDKLKEEIQEFNFSSY